MRKFLFIAISVIILGIAAYFAFIYYVPFSEGYRSGELIKFSRKGVLVKTWEGQISQGISGTNIFSFSVEDSEEEIIEKMKDFQGRYVKVAYKERYSTFFWLGDTKYFIIDIEPEESPHFQN
ncbi:MULTISPECIES: 6-phosphogluconate dehydrogenase [Flavobacteriaceae]|uniref:6-phosphogluconate dehydrogenase n=1 Tax=Flavobacteriaceae TaxID=49546 RepID=UPI001492E6C5|nr:MULTISPECIES: 6-phosphogluconate dehydrogenase [Allomuricauda]MDC6365040.1 6-phosphogluconate dehydrogenase [Muricauda sp. AC10]